MNRAQALEYVNKQEPIFLTRAKNEVNGAPSYVCPECGNGSGESGTGIALIPATRHGHKRWKCFKCGVRDGVRAADVAELWQRANPQYITTGEALAALYAYFRLDVDGRSTLDDFDIIDDDADGEEEQAESGGQSPNGQSNGRAGETDGGQKQKRKPNQTTEKPEYMRFCAEHIGENDYMQRRGISLETCRAYGVGYDPARYVRDAKTGEMTQEAAVIIPTGKENYFVRLIREGVADPKRRSVKGDSTERDFFNSQALQTAREPVFVVEGEIDALSIIEGGGVAVGLGSTSNVPLLLEKLKAQPPKQPLIIAMDADAAGQDAAAKAAEELTAAGISFAQVNPFKGSKDANEYLTTRGRVAMAAAVAAAKAQAEEKAEEQRKAEAEKFRAEYSAGAALLDFIQRAATDTPAISTGFKNFDEMLDGGLFEGLYIIGAISSLGKTAFVMQIADQIAQSGHDVLIMSLEMSKAELMARSISRHTAQAVIEDATGVYTSQDAKTARGITTHARYKFYSDKETALILAAIKSYAEYAGHVYIVEGIGDINAYSVRATVEKCIKVMQRPPVVIVDYIQILAPILERATDKQNMDKNVLELKRLSRDFKIPVIGISSFNRENYSNELTMVAFKESGAIEYSSDVLIGLQLQGTGTKNFDVDAAKSQTPRKIELKVLKNRAGITGKWVNFSYYPMFNYFIEE